MSIFDCRNLRDEPRKRALSRLYLCSVAIDIISRDLNIPVEKKTSSVLTRIWMNQPEGDHIPFVFQFYMLIFKLLNQGSSGYN